MIKKIFQWLYLSFAALIVLLALLTLLAQASIPYFNHHKGYFENYASQVLHLPVTFENLSVDWYWYEPRVHFYQVSVLDPEQKKTLVNVGELVIGIRPIHSLIKKNFYPSSVILKHIELNLYPFFFKQEKETEKFQINADKFRTLSAWLSQQPSIYLEDVQLNWHMQKPNNFPFQNLTFKLDLTHQAIRLVGAGFVKQDHLPLTPIKLMLALSPQTLENPLQATGEFYFQLTHFDLKTLQHFPELEKYVQNYHLQSGNISLQSWIHFDSGKLKKLTAVFQTQAMQFSSSKIKNKINFDFLNGQLYLENENNFWQGALSHLNFQMNEEKYSCKMIGFQFYLNAQKNQPQWFLQIEDANLSKLMHLILYSPNIPESVKKTLLSLNPAGDLKKLSLIKLNQQTDFPFYVAADFKNVSWQPQKTFFGANHLSGSFYFDDQTGNLQLKADKTLIQYPAWFSENLPAMDVELQLNWHALPKQKYAVQMTLKKLSNYDFSSTAQGAFIFSPEKLSKINLSGNFSIRDLSKIKYYLPDKFLDQDLSDWLKNAFIAGKLIHGKFNWQSEHKKKFSLSFQLGKTELHYQNDWQNIKNMQANVNTNGHSFDVIVNAGDLSGNQIQLIHTKISDLHHPILHLNARVLMNLENSLEFLKQSPLDLKDKLDFLNLSGQSLLNLNFQLPLKENASLLNLNGSFNLSDARLNFIGWAIYFNHLKGKVNFTDKTLEAKNIVGELLGEPIQIQLQADDQQLNAAFNGALKTSALSEEFKLPVQDYLSGSANYKASLTFDLIHHQANFNLTSNLLGIGIHIPKIYQKTPEMITPFDFYLKADHKTNVAIFSDFNHILSAALSFQKTKTNLKFSSGEVRLGLGRAQLQNTPGLVLSASFQKADWTSWKKLFSQWENSKKEKISSFSFSDLPIRVLHLDIASFTFLSHVFHQVDLRFYPAVQNLKLSIASPEITGECLIPLKSSQQVFSGNFSHFHVPMFKTNNKMESANLQLSHLPNFNFTFNDFRYGNYFLGRVVLKTNKILHGIKINQLKVNSSLLSAQAQGIWLEQPTQVLHLNGQINSNNIGQLLNHWHWTDSFENGQGSLTFNLTWNNLFTHRMTRQGNISIQIVNGRIINLNEQAQTAVGIGEFLNILSLQSLSQHLLDVSDWGKSGFAFDQLQADFAVTSDKLSTQNAFVKSEVADIQTKGNINLDNNTYDLYLKIEPHLTSSLPVLVGIVATPLAGAATWFADKLVGKQVSNAAASVYKITGPFNKPNVQKVSGTEMPLLGTDS